MSKRRKLIDGHAPASLRELQHRIARHSGNNGIYHSVVEDAAAVLLHMDIDDSAVSGDAVVDYADQRRAAA